MKDSKKAKGLDILIALGKSKKPPIMPMKKGMKGMDKEDEGDEYDDFDEEDGHHKDGMGMAEEGEEGSEDDEEPMFEDEEKDEDEFVGDMMSAMKMDKPEMFLKGLRGIFDLWSKEQEPDEDEEE